MLPLQMKEWSKMIDKFKLPFGIALLWLLTACGGGGGGVSGPVASSDTFPINKVWANILTTQSTNNITVSGNITSDDGKVSSVYGTGTNTFSSLSAGTFEGLPAQKQTSTTTVTLVGKDGVTVPINDKIYTWVDSNYTPKGQTSETSGDDYVVITSVLLIPTSAKINDTGLLYLANRYKDDTKAVLRGTRTASYVLEADTSSTALLTFILEDKNTSNVTLSKSTEQYRITPTGTFTRVKLSFVEGTTSLTVKYQ